MAFTTFTNTPFSEGAPFVLNSNGVSLATGFRVAMGDGTASPLYLSSTGIGIVNGANFRCDFVTEATANRTATLPNWSGKLSPEIVAVLASDHPNSTITATAVPSFSVALEAGALYEFEAILILQSAATTTGVQVSVEGPAEISHTTYQIDQVSTATLSVSNTWKQELQAFGTAPAYLTAAVANTNFLCLVKGVFRTTTTPALPLSFKVKSEVASSAVTVKADSILRVIRRA